LGRLLRNRSAAEEEQIGRERHDQHWEALRHDILTGMREWLLQQYRASALRKASTLNGRGNGAGSPATSDRVPRAKLARERHRRTPCRSGCSMQPQWQRWQYEETIQFTLHIGTCIAQLP
jgi:hypothetical protein